MLSHRKDLEKKIDFFKEKYPEGQRVPRPDYWGGFLIKYNKIEFWQDMPHRIHQRSVYEIINNSWEQYTLSP